MPGVADVKLSPYLREVFSVALDYAAQQYVGRANGALDQAAKLPMRWPICGGRWKSIRSCSRPAINWRGN